MAEAAAAAMHSFVSAEELLVESLDKLQSSGFQGALVNVDVSLKGVKNGAGKLPVEYLLPWEPLAPWTERPLASEGAFHLFTRVTIACETPADCRVFQDRALLAFDVVAARPSTDTALRSMVNSLARGQRNFDLLCLTPPPPALHGDSSDPKAGVKPDWVAPEVSTDEQEPGGARPVDGARRKRKRDSGALRLSAADHRVLRQAGVFVELEVRDGVLTAESRALAPQLRTGGLKGRGINGVLCGTQGLSGTPSAVAERFGYGRRGCGLAQKHAEDTVDKSVHHLLLQAERRRRLEGMFCMRWCV